MKTVEKEPTTTVVKGSKVDEVNIQNNHDSISKKKTRNSDVGKDIIEQSKIKSPFKTQSLRQLIEDAKNELPPSKLIGSLLYEKEQTILFAPTGLGKSILAMQMALSVSNGEDLDLGNDNVFKNEVGVLKTMLFDFELSNTQLKDRLGNIEIPNNLFISKIDRGNALKGTPKEIFKLMKKEAEFKEAKFLIIDNILKIGSELEKGDKAIELMESLWKLVRYEGFTILVITHTPKLDKRFPITSDSISGSSKIGQLSDAIIGINEVNSEEGNKVYIKQIKTRNGAIIYGKSNVICTEISKDYNDFVRHECYANCSEVEALRGNLKSDEGFNKKMFATANYFYYESYQKANKASNIHESTLKQRVKYLKQDYNDHYIKLKKMNKKELIEQIKMYSLKE